MMKRLSAESEISYRLSKIFIKSKTNSLPTNKENVSDNRKILRVKSKTEKSSLKDIARISEEGLNTMKSEMRASHFKLLNDFIVNYYLSQGELKFVPKTWKKHYLRIVVRGILRYAMNYDIDEAEIAKTITQFITLHGLPANETEITQFITLNSE